MPTLAASLLSSVALGQVPSIVPETLNTRVGEVVLQNQTNGKVYRTCKFDNFVLNGTVQPNSAASNQRNNTLTGQAAGVCAADTDDVWDTVVMQISLFDVDYPLPNRNASLTCDAEPLSDSYVLHGNFGIRSSSSGGFINTVNPVIATITTSDSGFSFSIVGDPVSKVTPPAAGGTSLHLVTSTQIGDAGTAQTTVAMATKNIASQLYVGKVLSQSPILPAPYSVLGAGGPVEGKGCFKPTVKQLAFTGTFNSVDDNLGDNLNTGVAGVQALDIGGDDADEMVDEQTGIATLGILASMLTSNLIPDSVPQVITSAAYTIRAKFRAPNGSMTTLDVPGVFNVPIPVVVPGSDVYIVTLTVVSASEQSTEQQNNGSISLRVQRAASLDATAQVVRAVSNLIDSSLVSGASCRALPLDISVLYPVQIPGGAIATSVLTSQVGFSTTTIAPRDFDLKLLRTDTGYKLSQKVVPCSSATNLNTYGFYTEPGKARELKVQFGSNISVNDLMLETKKDSNSGKQQVIYRASSPLAGLTFDSSSPSADLSIGLNNLPERIDICSVSGNQCNVPWRASKESLNSLHFSAYDLNGTLKPVSMYLTNKQFNDAGTETRVTYLNLDVANFSFDTKINLGVQAISQFAKPVTAALTGGLSLLFSGGKGFPYWVYLDTRGIPFTGSYTTLRGGDRTFVGSSGFTKTWDHELKLVKKWYGTKWKRTGTVDCNGFDVTFNNAPGGLENYIEQQFCRRKLPIQIIN